MSVEIIKRIIWSRKMNPGLFIRRISAGKHLDTNPEVIYIWNSDLFVTRWIEKYQMKLLIKASISLLPSFRLVESSTKFYHNKILIPLNNPGQAGGFEGFTNKITLTNVMKSWCPGRMIGWTGMRIGQVSLNRQIPAWLSGRNHYNFNWYDLLPISLI